jgi:NADH dehydrogenase FAD-containing subunit
LRVQAENSVFRAAEIVDNETKVIKQSQRNINRLADSELNQHNITPDLADQITKIKEKTAELALKGNSELVEGMQAVTD